MMPAPAPPGYPLQGYPPSPPPVRGPRGRNRLIGVIAASVVVAVGIIALIATQPWNRGSEGSDRPTVEVTGGDIGTPVELTGPSGSGTVTVTGARWTDEGEAGPAPGTRYLIVDVQLEGTSGELTTGGVFTAVVAADGRRYGISYGPVLDPLLTSRALRPGETNAGHLGYQLAPGPVQLDFQTPDGVLLGSVQIPGP